MRRAPLSLVVAALIFGMLTASQLKAVRTNAVAQLKRREQLQLLEQLEKEKKSVQEEVRSLREKLASYEKMGSSGKDVLEALRKDLERLRASAGLVAVKGPGISVTLIDNQKKPAPGEDPNLYVIHQEDLLNIVNELNAAGAEAVAINTQRLVSASSIRCVGPVVLVNSTRLAPPYRVQAIGDPKVLYAALTMPGGIADMLRTLGLGVKVEQKGELHLPAFSGAIPSKYARPVSSS